VVSASELDLVGALKCKSKKFDALLKITGK